MRPDAAPRVIVTDTRRGSAASWLSQHGGTFAESLPAYQWLSLTSGWSDLERYVGGPTLTTQL
jgi:hypothetical protein